jgi:IS1 family transposase
MANVLPYDKQISVIKAIVEGVSIRSIERMHDVHRDTIMRLVVKMGEACEKLLDRMMCDLPCVAIEIDEIWGYVAKKQKNVRKGEDVYSIGDQWTFVAIDADTKLIPCFRTGKRDMINAKAFLADLSSRLRNRIQLSSDALAAYPESVHNAFGDDVDYAQIVKAYEEEAAGSGRYSPPRVISVEKTPVIGEPLEERVSTSYVERQNLSIRMSNRRMTRLTNAFSKKLENHKAAMALHFANYNLCRVHRTLRVTPAMAAGVTDRVWDVEDLINAALLA